MLQDILGFNHGPLTVTLATGSLTPLSDELLQRALARGQMYEVTPQHKLPKNVYHRRIFYVEGLTNVLQEQGLYRPCTGDTTPGPRGEQCDSGCGQVCHRGMPDYYGHCGHFHSTSLGYAT